MAPPIASRRSLAPIFAALLTLPLAPDSASAQEPNRVERAQASFDAGRGLMQERRFAEACAKFAESQALDPGGGTILNLGICRRREGRTGTAFKVLGEALEQARADRRGDRVATAEKELAELSPDLSRVTIHLSAGAPAHDLIIELDGELLAPSQVGESLPLDPGEHQLRASQAGHEPWLARITLGPVADVQTITVPALVPKLPPAPLPVAPAVAPSQAAPTTPQPRPIEPAPVAKSSTLGFALVSVGGVALAAGSYFGIRAISLREQSNQYWNGTHCTEPSCVEDWNDAKTAAHLSTIGLSVGIAALGVGTYLLLRRPTSAHAAVALSLGVSGSDAHAAAIGQF